MKLRKNKMVLVGSAVLWLIPALLIVKAFTLDKGMTPPAEWLNTVVMLNTLMLPCVSGFVVTSLVQKEYQDGTLRNVLTAPVSKTDFPLAKLAVWFFWYLITLVVSLSISLCGYLMLHGGEVSYAAGLLARNGILSFLAGIPVLAVAFRQRKIFYPAVLTALFMAMIQMAGSQVSAEYILPGSICPWTAVAISGMVPVFSGYFGICLASIIVCGILGTFLAVQCFRRQEQ
ncbi:ABC transporter permease [Anaerovorax odorimutans]|uniref:ABC transporter permease n=2 Tax=Anaerovorax odorimutans TaxID=109327 RepID=A0ABT1RSV9_9FIRM|nr:ABC transporter permease [Anaerovorax odorimutans]